MSNMNGTTNTTHNTVTDVVPIEAKPKKPAKPRVVQNAFQEIQADLDAGSSQAKFVVNGWAGTYPSLAKEVSGDLPVGMSGCFSIGTKNYAVGQATNSLGGNTIEAFRDNKIKFLHVWLIGALTTHPNLLNKLAKERKYKKLPVRIKLNLRLLSLSSSKKADIAKVLGQSKQFTCEGIDYILEIANTDYLYPESYGAALEATRSISQDINLFHLVDLGGGTLTLSTYQKGLESTDPPKMIEQTASSGSGMKSILAKLSIVLAKVDRGGISYYQENLESALRNSKPLGKGEHSVKYRHGVEILEIGTDVTFALNEWVSKTPIVAELLGRISQALLDGRPVYATGGGFAISVIAEWVANYVCLGIDNPLFFILDKPEQVNLTGLKHLDVESKD
ncbi:hypothetical protein HW132_30885 [Brasilonema sp. CT11]|nr:hypothetical protein [Brasilonema sp. CT11]